MEITQAATSQSVFEINHSTHAAEARRFAVRWAEQAEISDGERGAIAIAVTEMAGNVVKHATSGKLVLVPIAERGKPGLRVLALDNGPGIRDIAAALKDGFSTAGTNGNGLGAVRRLASAFDLFSIPGRGTCVLADFWPHRAAPNGDGLELGVISLPIPGEIVCGDGWATKSDADRNWLMMVDGLGHGASASDAAREAERVFSESHHAAPSELLHDLHDALKKTRGAAGAVACIDRRVRTIAFAGLGNIAASVINSRGSRGIASHNGTLGHQMHRIQEFNLPWDGDSILVMHSDGLSSRWDLSPLAGIWSHKAGLIASVLYRDFNKGRDDVTVLVAKNRVE